MSVCTHAGWGTMGYAGETGPVPPPAELRLIEGGHECPVCGYRMQVLTGDAAQTVAGAWGAQRETATLARETR